MYVVIFKAVIKELDDYYVNTASKLRELAKSYGCSRFESFVTDKEEIALSYWPDRESIRRWGADPEHQAAQALGKSHWYTSYSVEIAELK
jgi:heme-degrading monooxygenase HmoA